MRSHYKDRGLLLAALLAQDLGATVQLDSSVQYSTVQYSTVQHFTVQYSTALYSTSLYCTWYFAVLFLITQGALLYYSSRYFTVQLCSSHHMLPYCRKLSAWYFTELYLTMNDTMRDYVILYCTVMYCT